MFKAKYPDELIHKIKTYLRNYGRKIVDISYVYDSNDAVYVAFVRYKY